MDLEILLQKNTDLEAENLELREKLNISITKDLVWVTRDEVKKLQLCDEQTAHIKRVKAAIVDFKMASLKDIHERLSDLYDIANENLKQSLAHHDAEVISLLHIKLIAEFIEHPDGFTEMFDFIGRYTEQLKEGK